MKLTQVLIARHGQTEWNIQGIHQGHRDSPLTAVGRAQARALGARLREQKFSRLYSSDLGRALETANAIAEQTGHPVTVDSRLRERKLGVFEGFALAEIQERFPAEYALYRAGRIDHAMPGGESIQARYDQTVECLEELAARHEGETIVVVTHGGVLSAAFRHVLGIPLEAPRRFRLFNASLNAFGFEKGVWSLQSWGDVGHLRQIGTSDDY